VTSQHGGSIGDINKHKLYKYSWTSCGCDFHQDWLRPFTLPASAIQHQKKMGGFKMLWIFIYIC